MTNLPVDVLVQNLKYLCLYLNLKFIFFVKYKSKVSKLIMHQKPKKIPLNVKNFEKCKERSKKVRCRIVNIT